METDIRYNEPSSPAFERETAASAEQWANWTDEPNSQRDRGRARADV